MNGRRVEKDFYTVNEFLPLESEIPPLTFARERTDLWAPGKSLENFAVLHPGARWIRKRWPREQWIELGRKLAALNLPLTVSAGPDSEEVELAGTIANALGPAAITTEGKLSWPQLAGLLYRARLFVGVDTAAMHLAAACHCPTVAIFGASRSPTWRALAWNCSNREDMKRTVDAGLKLCKVLRLETAGLDNGAEKLSRRSKSKRELSAGGCVQAAVHVSVGYPSGQRGQTVNLKLRKDQIGRVATDKDLREEAPATQRPKRTRLASFSRVRDTKRDTTPRQQTSIIARLLLANN
jgi:hypothetical protein